MEKELVKSQDKVNGMDKESNITRYTDKELRDIHHQQGFGWRSHSPYRSLSPATEEFRSNYDSIFRKENKARQDKV